MAERIGERLRRFREQRGLSQVQLGRRANVPQPVISRLESGEQSDLAVSTAVRLCRVLGISVDRLIGDAFADDDEPHPSLAIAAS